MNFKITDLNSKILKVKLTLIVLFLTISYQGISQSASMGCSKHTYLGSTGTVIHYPLPNGNDSIKTIAFPWDIVTIHAYIDPSCGENTIYLHKNGVVIDTAVYPTTFTLTSSGRYMIWDSSVPIFPPCIVEFVNPTDLSENSSLEYRYYPNPVSDFLNFELPINGLYQIQISNSLNKVLNTYITKENSNIDLRNLPQGMFYFQLFKDEKYVGGGKFIKI